jgi:hypothetical protein
MYVDVYVYVYVYVYAYVYVYVYAYVYVCICGCGCGFNCLCNCSCLPAGSLPVCLVHLPWNACLLYLYLHTYPPDHLLFCSLYVFGFDVLLSQQALLFPIPIKYFDP